MIVDQLHEFFPEPVNRKAVINIEENRSNNIRSLACPVLKWIFKKIINGQDHSPVVPDAHDNIRKRNFFDPPEFIFYNHFIIDPEGLRKSNLEPRQQVSKRSLRSEANDNSADAYTCEQPRS